MAAKSSTVRILPPCRRRGEAGRQRQGLSYGAPGCDAAGGPELDADHQAREPAKPAEGCRGATGYSRKPGPYSSRCPAPSVHRLALIASFLSPNVPSNTTATPPLRCPQIIPKLIC